MSASVHKVILTFDGNGLSAKLVCPPGDTCQGGLQCGLCGRDYEDPEGRPCYDCKDAKLDECWIKTWFDNEPADELLRGSVEVTIDASWDLDHLVATIVEGTDASSSPTGSEAVDQTAVT